MDSNTAFDFKWRSNQLLELISEVDLLKRAIDKNCPEKPKCYIKFGYNQEVNFEVPQEAIIDYATKTIAIKTKEIEELEKEIKEML